MDMQHSKSRPKSTQWPAHPKQRAKHRVSQHQFVWVKFYKLSKFCRIGTSASSMKQTKIINNYIKNIMPNITKHYPQIKLYFPGVKGARTPEIDWRKFSFQEQREKLTTAHIPQTEHPFSPSINAMFIAVLEVLTDQKQTKIMTLKCYIVS